MVILVPVADSVFSYIWTINPTIGWLLNFVTDYPTRDPKYFTRSRQKYLLGLRGYFPRWLRDVVFLERQGDEVLPPCRIEYIKTESKFDALRRSYSDATRYILWSNRSIKTFISPEEASRLRYPEEHSVDLTSELIPFVQSVLPELERIQVPKGDRWKPRPSKAKIDDSMPVVVEVHLPLASKQSTGLECDEIGDQLDGDLQEKGLGGMMTIDSLGVDEFEVVLEVSPRRVKSALRQIRRTLRRLKAPDSAYITFMGPDGPERHPLLEPKGG